MKQLTEIKKESLAELTKGMLSASRTESAEAGNALVRKAKDFGLNVDNFLRLAVNMEDEEARQMLSLKPDMDGFEMVLAKLNLPTQNNFKKQVVLQQSSDTFATYPGTRALFPYVIDSLVRWEDRMSSERVADLVASSRTISGVELVRVVGEDSDADRKSHLISEGSKIPVRTVRTREQSVKFFKHGSGLQFTYEFERRAALDIITPFVARVARELEMSKVAAATNIMINGDGVNPAATAFDQETLDTAATDGTISYNGFLAFATAMAKKGTPIDTIAGGYDAYMQYLKMIGVSASSANFADKMAEKGAPTLVKLDSIYLPIRFVLDTAVPDGKLLGFNKAETMEELVEANSRINEQQVDSSVQITTYYKTENTGYSLIFGDTRGIYTYKKD